MCNYYSNSVYMFIIVFNIVCSCATNKNRNMLALVFGRVRASCFGMISHDSTALWRLDVHPTKKMHNNPKKAR